MKLKSFGCSFIFGTDLADDGRDLLVPTPSNYTWPALLAKHHGYDYECRARPGSGNLQILESLLNELYKNESAVYVIGWSWIDRFDCLRRTTNYWLPWDPIMPSDTDLRAKVYYKEIHSQYQDKLTTLIYMKSAIDMLKNYNAKFLMTYMDYLIFETQWHCSPAVLELQKNVKPYLHTFDELNLLDYSKKYNYKISEKMHPLEEAHASAAEYIINHNLL